MRVIQTQFAFERGELNFREEAPLYPSVSCAYFKLSESEDELGFPIYHSDLNLSLEGPGPFARLLRPAIVPVLGQPTQKQIEAFLDGCLYDRAYSGIETFEGPRNPKIVDYILDQTIIIEESPPKAVALKSFIGPGSIISVGTFIGYSVAPYPLLMFITVPMGIVAVGASVGVAVAMQQGLHNAIKRRFDGKWPQTRRRKR